MALIILIPLTILVLYLINRYIDGIEAKSKSKGLYDSTSTDNCMRDVTFYVIGLMLDQGNHTILPLLHLTTLMNTL